MGFSLGFYNIWRNLQVWGEFAIGNLGRLDVSAPKIENLEKLVASGNFYAVFQNAYRFFIFI